jgi:hypothetical protein
MQFTEAELTAAMTGYAKATLVAQDKNLRKGKADVEQVWHDLGGYGRYQLLDGLSALVLPVLAALPDVPRVHGQPLRFSTGQVAAAIEQTVTLEGGRIKRKAVVLAQAALLGAALAELPPWFDPEQLLPEA